MYFSRVRLRPEIFRNTQLTALLSDNVYNPHRLLWDLFAEEKKRKFLFREEIAREQLDSYTGVRGEPLFYIVSSCKPGNKKLNPIFMVEAKEYKPRLRSGDKLSFELRANPVVTRAGKKHDVVMNAQRSFLKTLCEKCDLLLKLPVSPAKKDYKKIPLSCGGKTMERCITDILIADTRYSEKLQHWMGLRDRLEWALKAVVEQELDNWLKRQGKQHGFEICIDRNQAMKLQCTGYQWHELFKKDAKGRKSGFSSVDFTGELQVRDTERFSRALFKGIGRSKAFGCGLMMVKRLHSGDQ
jgi:CRISPR system Cascade subunit CasE